VGRGRGGGARGRAAKSGPGASATHIPATTGGRAKPGTWHVFVIAPDGTASQAVNGDQFTYTIPVVSAVSPKSGPTGGGTPITITGKGFVAGERGVIGQGNGAGAGAVAATRGTVGNATHTTTPTGGRAHPRTAHH